MSLAIPNLEFLEAAFLDLPDDSSAAICGFAGDPNAPPEFAWSARPWCHGSRLPSGMTASTNNYLAVSSFRPDTAGKIRRRKDQFARLHMVMIDDLGTKVAPGRIRLPLSAEIETSPGNTQGFYFLEPSAGSDARAIAERFIEQLVAEGLTSDGKDPGMMGVTRYGRLPVGVNGKRKYVEQLGHPFRCRTLVWAPERRYTVEQIALAYRLDLALPPPRVAPPIPQGAANQRVQDFADLMRFLSDSGRYLQTTGEGIHQILCPWLDGHSDRAETGTAVMEPSERNRYAGGFKCYHGNCAARGIGDVYRWVRAKRATVAA